MKEKALLLNRLGLFILTLVFISALRPITQVAKGHIQDRDLKVRSTKSTQLPPFAKRWALVIGIDEYQDESIDDLEGASNDAKTLADALTQYAAFPREQVFLLSSGQSLERRPTRKNILKALSILRSLIPQDGLILIAFSGHGIAGYLIPEDADAESGMSMLEVTSIPITVVEDFIRDAEIQQTLILMDSCRNSTRKWILDLPYVLHANRLAVLNSEEVQRFNIDIANKRIKVFAVLFATEVGYLSYEYAQEKQGYFTWAFVKGLAGEAATDDGEITLGSLINHVTDTVPILVACNERHWQRPLALVQGEGARELVIGVSRSIDAPKIIGTEARTQPNKELTGSWEATAYFVQKFGSQYPPLSTKGLPTFDLDLAFCRRYEFKLTINVKGNKITAELIDNDSTLTLTQPWENQFVLIGAGKSDKIPQGYKGYSVKIWGELKSYSITIDGDIKNGKLVGRITQQLRFDSGHDSLDRGTWEAKKRE